MSKGKSLVESDIPGASLEGRAPENLKVKELQRWLLCRGASIKGKKADLIARVRAYIQNGWADNIVDPDKPANVSSSDNAYLQKMPVDGWLDIQNVFTSIEEVPAFSNAQIVTYFVTRTVADGLPAADFKSMNKSAENLFKCGHVQNIQLCTKNRKSKEVWVKAVCLPEMRKDREYKLVLTLDTESTEICSAQCGCPAGRGPGASCKHVAALCYAIANFCSCGRLPGFLTCTERLQEWNKPRGKRVEAIPVEEFGSRKQRLLGQLSNNKQRPIPKEYDPRPLPLRSPDPLRIERLRVDLLSVNHQSCMLHLLCPPSHVVHHDHCYSKQNVDSVLVESSSPKVEYTQYYSECEFQQLCEEAKSALNVSTAERLRIESETREQSNTQNWHAIRARRITGSKCGKILVQRKKTPALLKSVMYGPSFTVLPNAIKWERDNECVACAKYMKAHHHPEFQVYRCGFIIHPEFGWLGASPDARVTDPSSQETDGIAEFKCPYSKRELTVEEACADTTFYAEILDEKLHLKRNHVYYHQVQLQLYVGLDLYKWCDFCIYTTKGIMVERISIDPDWCDTNISQLESYFNAHMLPEIVYPQLKPSYFL